MNFEILESPKRVYKPNEIIEAFEPASISTIGRSLTKISAKYSNDAVFDELSDEEKSEIYFQSVKYNVDKILAAVGIGIGVGTLVGAPVGALGGTFVCPGVGTTAGAAIGGASGAAIGLAAGTGFCVHRKYYYDSEIVRFHVEPTYTYTQFQNAMNKESHEILASFVNRYEELLYRDTQREIRNHCCPITCEIPVNPVFAPYDHARLVPMEKEAIEAHIDNKALEINRARASGARPSYIQSLLDGVDPLKRGYYTKNQLIYDQAHVRKMLMWFQRIHSDLLEKTKKEASVDGLEAGDNDFVLMEGLDRLICHYKKCYKASVSYTIDQLCQDAIEMGVPFAKTNAIHLFMTRSHERILACTGDSSINGDVVRMNLGGKR